ncbi:helix-turn-helix domain-containing protein [Methylobacterium nodulans]|uniref:Transcriptional regulator, XRE family n=1 Tax=Methylobacterium nodulans (strain LMG 21967 / CNCM I-2342 / ORS 2060) TaxID=460265 RepID=B8IW00_METNO|nr:XRE family transcriptional regulator [Methylobacterium nodulans]ACL62590.1 transcriptional regulator, XRE family [Methylobacterium nodulans ORS 2060]
MDVVLDPDPREGRAGGNAEQSLGQRLRELRRSRKLTLQQVSDRSGISLSSLSKIERDELSPTVTTLERIAAGYEIDSAAIFGGREAVHRAPGRRSITRADGGRSMPTGTCDNVWLCPELSHKLMTPILTTVTARSLEDYTEWARYEAEVFMYVLSGSVIVHSQIYEPTRLATGESMYYDASTPHLWVTESKDPAKVLWLYATYR